MIYVTHLVVKTMFQLGLIYLAILAERFVEAVQLILVAFCKRCLSCFPADFQILVMNRLVGLAVCHGVLNAGNDLHAVRCFLHSGVDALGLLTHSLQGCIQIFQREKLILFQIDDGLGDCLQIIGRAFLQTVPRPVATFCLSQVQIVTKQKNQIGRGVLCLRFRFCKPLLVAPL